MSENNTPEVNKQEEKTSWFSRKGLRKSKGSKVIPNLYDYKLQRVFDYQPLSEEKAYRGAIGIPRVLNMFENYPFWHTFFTCLGYRVILSPLSSREIYDLGSDSIQSESECYPAKLVHGHIRWLLAQGVKNIFFPCVVYERKEIRNAANHLNCPVVAGYGTSIRNNVSELSDVEITFLDPFVSFESEGILTERLCDVFTKFDIPEYEIRMASLAGWKELGKSADDIRRRGEEVLKFLKKTRRRGIVLAGHPYHLDPEVNHGIPDQINSLGLAVLTEDSVAHLGKSERFYTTTDHWTYSTRLLSAASFVATQRNLEYVQLTSCGCGLGCITTNLIKENLTASGKLFTQFDMAETDDAELTSKRIRSMLMAFNEVDFSNEIHEISPHKHIVFTSEMRDSYTLLCPRLSPYHFVFFDTVMKRSGYKLELLPFDEPDFIQTGYGYVDSTVCTPSALIVGSIITALQSGHYDIRKTAVLVPQPNDGCPASCNSNFVRHALSKAGFGGVPVIPLGTRKLEKHPGFKIKASVFKRGIEALIYGDLLMRLVYRTRPYEMTSGSVDELYQTWVQKCTKSLKHGNKHKFWYNIKKIISDFDLIPLDESAEKPRVGIVGEIFSLYNPLIAENTIERLEAEGCEVVVPNLSDYFAYAFLNEEINAGKFGKKQKNAKLGRFGIKVMNYFSKPVSKALKKSKRFTPAPTIDNLADNAAPIISLGNQFGEGWLLAGEAVGFLKSGIHKIICIQPVSCLPGHVVCKGIVNELKRRYPEAEIEVYESKNLPQN